MRPPFSYLILVVGCSLNARMSPTACFSMWNVGVLHMSDHVHACMTALRPSDTAQHNKA